jgi:hypothetical protein
VDWAREQPLSPLDSPKRSPDVGLWVASSDLENRIDLGIEVPHSGDGFSKGDVTESASYLGLPGTLSQIGGQRPAIAPDLLSTIQICASIPAAGRPDDVPPVVPLAVPFNRCALPPPTRSVGESKATGIHAEFATAH